LLVAATGAGFLWFSPGLGLLGAFLTGSDTSANLLFGGVQKSAALQLGLDPLWTSAGNASGACLGKMISPQSISLGMTAAELDPKSSSMVLRETLPWCIGLTAILALWSGIVSRVF
jgi:lactate permease